MPNPWRQGAERRSAPFAVYLRSLPRWLPPTTVSVVLVAGLLLPGLTGAAALLLVAGFLEWLLTLSWPVLSMGARGMRVIALLLLLFLAVAKIRP